MGKKKEVYHLFFIIITKFSIIQQEFQLELLYQP
jgi:hypothetical protein